MAICLAPAICPPTRIRGDDSPGERVPGGGYRVAFGSMRFGGQKFEKRRGFSGREGDLKTSGVTP